MIKRSLLMIAVLSGSVVAFFAGRLELGGALALAQSSTLTALDYVKTSEGWRIKSRTHVRNKAWHHPMLRTPDLNQAPRSARMLNTRGAP